MNEAVNRLADSQRPNADEPIEAPSRVHMPPPAPPPPPARPPDDGVRARGLTVVQTRPERRWPGVARARRSGRRERGGESPSDSLRPNADEPIEAPRRVHMPPPASPPPPARLPLLAAPSVSVAQGRLLSAPVNRREFRRSDVVVVRASVTGSPDISARLLNQVGQPWRTCRLPSATARARRPSRSAASLPATTWSRCRRRPAARQPGSSSRFASWRVEPGHGPRRFV